MVSPHLCSAANPHQMIKRLKSSTNSRHLAPSLNSHMVLCCEQRMFCAIIEVEWSLKPSLALKISLRRICVEAEAQKVQVLKE